MILFSTNAIRFSSVSSFNMHWFVLGWLNNFRHCGKGQGEVYTYSSHCIYWVLICSWICNLVDLIKFGISLHFSFLLKESFFLRNTKTRASDHQFINTLLTEQQDAQSITLNLNSNQATFYRFQWSERKDEGSNQVSELASKNRDTTPARHLTSTSRRILTPNRLASKADTLHGFRQHRSSGQRNDTKQTPSFSTSNINGRCQPKNHVVFLKTHKTASSTILNILYRYGDTHNLTFALPLYMHSQLYYPHFFMSHFVEGMKSRQVTEFHIMCNHMRFRKTEVRKCEHSNVKMG